jgi:hypothetical protein
MGTASGIMSQNTQRVYDFWMPYPVMLIGFSCENNTRSSGFCNAVNSGEAPFQV